MSKSIIQLYQSVGLLLASISLRILAAEIPAQSLPNPLTINSVTIPFEIRRGHVMVPARVNGSKTLSLLLDTGYGITMLHPDHVESFGLRRSGSVTIVGIAGEVPAGVFEGPTFDFSGVTWKSRRIAAFPPDNQSRSRRRDGILGSGFFKRFVVEINSQRKTLTLHAPDTYQYSGLGEILPLTFKSSTPIVGAFVGLPDRSEVTARFEIDTGCDGALCIGRHFIEAHQLVPASSTTKHSGRVGVGGAARTRTSHLAQLRLGNLIVEKPTANLFLEGSPVDAPLAGHIGWELLRDFKVIFDYSRQRIILEPSKPVTIDANRAEHGVPGAR